MKKIRIRLEDGTFARVPMVAKHPGDGDYVWFKDCKRHVYVYPTIGAIAECPNDVFSRDYVDDLVECSVEEFNEVVRSVVEKKYICHE